MSISRRKFTRIAIFGGASFATSSGIFFPKPAEAYSLEFPLKALSASKVFDALLRYSAARAIPGVLSPILQGSSNIGGQIEPGAASVIRLADQVLVNRQFTKNRTELARAGAGAATSLLWGRQRQENLGPNVGFGFVQKYEDSFTDAKISGPTMTGIYNAQKVLVDQRLTPDEIAGSLLPVRSTLDDLGSWAGDNDPSVGVKSGVGFTQYQTASGIVTSRYDLVVPGPNGFGTVQIIIEADEQPRRNITITVKFG
ncbi:MAG TPA: hypothetical protein V6D11_08385 [Waterburya sp.]|jgi:hypothetical protein